MAAAVDTNPPLLSFKLNFTGIVLPDLYTPLPSLLTGGRKPEKAYFTVTFCVAAAILPLVSVAVQITTVVPILNPPWGALFVTSLRKRSVASALPISTGVKAPERTVSISLGAEITGGVVSTTVTFLTAWLALLPAASVTS